MFKRATQHVLGLMGYRIIKTRKRRTGVAGGHVWDLNRFGCGNLPVRTVIDVGVADGTPGLYRAFPNQDLVLIEPISEQLEVALLGLQSRPGKVIAHHCAAGEMSGKQPLYFDESRAHQSSLERRTIHSEDSVRVVPVEPLDSLVGEQYSAPYFLKVDVEGAELQVLRGGRRCLSLAAGVAIEANLGFLFEGVRNPLPEIDELMQQHGLGLYGVLAARWGDDTVRLVDKVDLLYVAKRYT